VRTGAKDVYASAYLDDGKALTCVGSGATGTVPVTLSMGWAGLGLDPAHVRATVPGTVTMQAGRDAIDLAQPIDIAPGQGIVIGLERE
jgi:hypothetical protein